MTGWLTLRLSGDAALDRAGLTLNVEHIEAVAADSIEPGRTAIRMASGAWYEVAAQPGELLDALLNPAPLPFGMGRRVFTVKDWGTT